MTVPFTEVKTCKKSGFGRKSQEFCLERVLPEMAIR